MSDTATPIDQDKLDKITRQIRAMLDRAESTNHDGERETCMEQAERLMMKYAISKAMIDGTRIDPSGVTKFGIDLEDPYAVDRGTLLHQVAKVFNCEVIRHANKYLRQYRNLVHYEVYGFQADLDLVFTLYQSLEVQLNESMYSRGGSVSYKKAFIQSFSNRSTDRMREFYKEEQELVPGSGLVLADRGRVVRDAFEDANPDMITARRRSSSFNWEGSLAGHEAGEKADVTLSGKKLNRERLAIGS